MPILFFGDLHAYFSSTVRVLSVGLNSSLHEFPTDSPFRRFPLAEGVTVREPEPYLDALSAYRQDHGHIPVGVRFYRDQPSDVAGLVQPVGLEDFTPRHSECQVSESLVAQGE